MTYIVGARSRFSVTGVDKRRADGGQRTADGGA